MIEVRTGAGHPRVAEAVLFPFDDQGIPFSAGLRLHLVSGKSPGTQNPIVLAPGAAGAPDDARTRFYGTVIPVGDELRMWYLGTSRGAPGRPGSPAGCWRGSRRAPPAPGGGAPSGGRPG